MPFLFPAVIDSTGEAKKQEQVAGAPIQKGFDIDTYSCRRMGLVFCLKGQLKHSFIYESFTMGLLLCQPMKVCEHTRQM